MGIIGLRNRGFQRAMVAVISLMLAGATIAANTVHVPAETPVYLVTKKEIIAKRKLYDIGDTIPVEVWRDVIIDGVIVIKVGTPATLRVDAIKGRNIVGIRGNVSFSAVDTNAIDGQTINLGGGYKQKGAGRVALSATLGVLVFWPALFIPGGVPRFPADTIFNAYTDGSYNVASTGQERPIIRLGSEDRFTAEVDYEKLLVTEKPKDFEFVLYEVAGDHEFFIDSINGVSVKPLKLEKLGTETDQVRAAVPIKKLSKKFQKGINRFEVAYTDASGDRISSEVILEIEY